MKFGKQNEQAQQIAEPAEQTAREAEGAMERAAETIAAAAEMASARAEAAIQQAEQNEAAWEKAAAWAERAEAPQAAETGKPTSAAILQAISEISGNTAHIQTALELLKNFELNTSLNGGMGDAARAEAIQAIVQSSEATNQKTLALLTRMYEDLSPQMDDKGKFASAEKLEFVKLMGDAVDLDDHAILNTVLSYLG